MKKNILILAIAFLSLAFFTPKIEVEKKRIVVPEIYEGKEIFICSVPVELYEVVKTDLNFLVWDIDEPKDLYKNLIKKGIKEEFVFDAVLIDASGGNKLI